MAAKDVMYETHFHQLEAMMQLRSVSEVTQLKDVLDTKSLAHLMVRPSIGSGSGNAIFSFFFSFFFFLFYFVLIIIRIWNDIATLVKIDYILISLVVATDGYFVYLILT
jgi:hypothetical protein